MEFLDNISLAGGIASLVTLIAAVISWISTRIKSKTISKYKRFIFLFTITSWGVSSGLLITTNLKTGIIIFVVLLGSIFIIGKNYQFLLNSIIDSNSTVIASKKAIYHTFCETIQRISLTLTDDKKFDGNDIRVSLFFVDWEVCKLSMVGRYPIDEDDNREIKYTIGRGTSGMSAKKNKKIIAENLPEWNKNSKLYIKKLKKYNLSEEEIRKFRVKARCYYAFPIQERDSNEAVNMVRFVIHVDSVHPSISSSNTSSKNFYKVIKDYINNSRQLLFKTFIGKGF